MIYDNIQSLRHFRTIVNLLKINYLDKSNPLFEGKNLHEIVKDLENELTLHSEKLRYVDKSTKVKIGLLFETKEMNSPFYFSWEFTFGTYLPIFAPFSITLVQVLFKLFKRNRSKKAKSDAKVKAD